MQNRNKDGAADDSYSALLFSVRTVFVCFSCFLFLKNYQFYQGWTAEHSAEHTTKSFTGFWLFGRLALSGFWLFGRFDYSDVFRAIALVKRFRSRRRGKRAGALVKLHQRGLRTPLPSIHLANLHSLPNKTDEHLLLSQTNKEKQGFFKLCFSVFHGNLAEWRNTGQRATSA